MLTGRTLSHYRIGDEISRGGMGVVYEALDVKLNRSVALKVLPPELVFDEERKRRFVIEAQATAALKHPNVAVIYEVYEVDGVTFIAMELIDGETLSALAARGALPFARALQLAGEVADGLSAAHEAGIVHRDLKPGNVMVTSDGHPKIIDFGLAKLLEPSGGEDSALATAVKAATETGQVMGTLAYMSPEQARGEKVDHRSDIFSFGIVVYEVLTGSLPFAAASAIELPHAIINDAPAALPASLPSAPELQRIVERCLAKDPRDRYQTARDLFLDLRHVQRSPVATDGPKTSRPIGARSWLPSVIALGAIVLAVFAVVSSRPARDALPRVVRTARLTHDPGLELDAAISPDGKMAAYAKGAIGQTKIFVQQISGGRPVPLTVEFPGAHFRPRWSPDGAQIAFSTRMDRVEEVYVVPALGGAPRRIVESGSELAWSPDGAELAYLEGVTDSDELHVASADGKRREKLASPGQGTAPAWSPRGDRIAYAVGNSGYLLGSSGVLNVASSSIWAVSSEGGEPVRLTEDAHLDSSPQWTPDGRHMLFVSDRGGTRDIYRLTLTRSGESDGAPQRLTTGLQVHSISLSADGTRLVYSVLNKKQNIWSVPIPSQRTVSVREASPVTVGNQEIEGIAVSLDGKWLAFDSNRSGNRPRGLRMGVRSCSTPSGVAIGISTSCLRTADPFGRSPAIRDLIGWAPGLPMQSSSSSRRFVTTEPRPTECLPTAARPPNVWSTMSCVGRRMDAGCWVGALTTNQSSSCLRTRRRCKRLRTTPSCERRGGRATAAPSSTRQGSFQGVPVFGRFPLQAVSLVFSCVSMIPTARPTAGSSPSTTSGSTSRSRSTRATFG